MAVALVTGADGFIGSHLVEMLVDRGYQVKALVQYNSFNSWGWLESVSCLDDLDIHTGDIRDPFFCKVLLENVDVVFHLAALIAIPYSYVAPNSYIETNVQGTLNICQAAKENGNLRVINTSTSEVYGTAQYVPIDEEHPLQPQSPYSASKISAEAIAMSFYNSFDLPVTVARPFNTYGPRQSARAVIPTIISQMSSGIDEIKLGDLSPTRDFNYVEDTCRGLIAISDSSNTVGQIVNIGSNYEISIGETFKLIKEIMGSEAVVIEDSERMRPNKSEVFRLWCNNNKLIKLTGFSPQVDITSGLKKTVDWFLENDNINRYKANIYNV